MRARLGVAAATAGLLHTSLAATAIAAVDTTPTPVTVDLEQVDAEPDGTTTVTVTFAGLSEDEQVDVGDVQVLENGVEVDGVRAVASEDLEGEAVPAVVVAIDTSGSLREGDAIAVARAAATDLATDIIEDGGLVAVVAFADDVETRIDLTDDADAVAATIAQLTAEGATALYDGIARSIRLADSHDGSGDVVVFTDGEDNGSTTGLQRLLAIAADAEVPVTGVQLLAEGGEDAPLDAVAAASGGRVLRIDDIDELGSAFDRISADLRRRLTLTWTTPATTERTQFLDILVNYLDETGAVVANDAERVVNPRAVQLTPARPVEVPGPFVAGLATDPVLAVAIGVIALAVMLLGVLVLGTVLDRRRATRLDRRLSVYEEGRTRATALTPGRPERSLTDRAVDVVDVIPRPATIDARTAARIEQADWPMRVGELLLMMVSIGLLFFLFVLLTVQAPWWLALPVGVIGAALPVVALQVAVDRRQRAFADQLPDVLQVIGGALRAGHAFSTAVEGAVVEVDEPAAGELRRASVEARLGRPMDEALLGVADRMESVDLTWVVGALTVQREAGGNLAEVLGNVAATLRARASVRRQVQALSAEGRLSANIISVIPFLMFVVLTILSPDYMSILFERPTGRVLILVGLALLAIGIVWLRRVVRPRF